MKNLDIRMIVTASEIKYKDIAAEMNITKQYLSHMMANDISLSKREKILKAIEHINSKKSDGSSC